MQKIIQSSGTFEKKQQEAQKANEQLKSSMKGMGTSSGTAAMGIGTVTAKIAGLVSAAYLGKKAVDIMFTAIKAGAQQQVQLNTFQALVGDDKAGSALYDYVGAYAKKSALGKTDLANATTSFLAYTRNIEQIEKLNKLTERLYAKDPTQGAKGAVFALKEVLAGDTMSIKDRFNMSGISGEKIRKLAGVGDINGIIEYLDQVFTKFGASQAVVDKNFTSLFAQTDMFKTNFMQAMGEEASPAVQNLSLVMQQLNSDMAVGKFQPFFSLMANGAAAIGNGMAWVMQNANFLIPTIGGVVTAIVVYNAAMLLANTISLLTGITISTVAGQWLVAAALIAGAAGGIALSASLTSQNSDLKKNALSIADAKAAATKAMSGMTTAKMPVEITNKSPISVKGTVEIEKENQKYWFDLAAQKAIATFSMMQVLPQVNIQNQNISKETDANEVINIISNAVSSATGTQPQGVYQ